MPEQGKVVKCSCSKCSRSGNGLGYNWVSTETARLHQAHDNRQAWMKERNRKIEAEALGNYVQPRRGPTEPSPFVANQEIDENDVCRLETYLMFMLSSTLLNNALYHRFRYLTQPKPQENLFNVHVKLYTTEQCSIPQVPLPQSSSSNAMPPAEDSFFADPPPPQSPSTPRSPSPVPLLDPHSDYDQMDHVPHLFPEPPPIGHQNSLEIEYGADENESMYCAGYDATNDPPYIRLAYLSAVESSVIHHNSVAGVNAWLRHRTRLKIRVVLWGLKLCCIPSRLFALSRTNLKFLIQIERSSGVGVAG
ncbi:unnamed protein product [Rhizoctonia solani]|uniref:Uncharacterized protein n=1 Tax=Rhizoctonia solani TaxID=456999 RepID=A0A8H2X047_9AGAM|nr:unnamed protein product [Rhizoctonia solani]